MVIEVIFWGPLIRILPQTLNFEYPTLLSIQCMPIREYCISNQNLSYFAFELIVLAPTLKQSI